MVVSRTVEIHKAFISSNLFMYDDMTGFSMSNSWQQGKQGPASSDTSFSSTLKHFFEQMSRFPCFLQHGRLAWQVGQLLSEVSVAWLMHLGGPSEHGAKDVWRVYTLVLHDRPSDLPRNWL